MTPILAERLKASALRLEIGMPDSRRFRVTGGIYFFTVNFLEWRLGILARYTEVLRDATGKMFKW